VGAESGRGLRAFATLGPGVGVDAGAGGAEGFSGVGVGVSIEFSGGQGRVAKGVNCTLRSTAGFRVPFWISCSLDGLIFSLRTFFGGGPS
jgi:hypothetical protein